MLRELAAVAFSDIGDLFDRDGRPVPVHDLDPVTRRAVAAVSIGRVDGPAGVVSEKFRGRASVGGYGPADRKAEGGPPRLGTDPDAG